MRVSDPFEDVEVDPAPDAADHGRRRAGRSRSARSFFPTQAAVVAVILALFVMIMLHELGHFLAAKRSGMKVTEFFVGFGPRLWSFTRGETEYGIKAVPLGGYCRIIGMTNLEEVAPEDEPRAYRNKRTGPKVFVAGGRSGRALRHRARADVRGAVLRGRLSATSSATTDAGADDAGRGSRGPASRATRSSRSTARP